MLSALVVMALAATFALAIAGAVHALQVVTAADADAGRVSRLEADALTEVLRHLRWAPAQPQGAASGGDPASGARWTAEWQTGPPVAGSPWARRDIRTVAVASRARRSSAATVESRVEDWAVGVSCARDAEMDAPLVVSGAGLYVGGSLRGREQVTFVPGPAGTTPDGRAVDGARGEGLLAAAVHAGAGIFSGGVETHDTAGVPFADDRDPHTGAPPPAAWTADPTPEFLAAARDEGEGPGDAFSGGVLQLAALGPADPDQAIAGRCLVLPAGDEVSIEGVAPTDAEPLLIVVPGDATVGRPGQLVVLRGGLLVCGRLHVRGQFVLTGSLHAGSLVVQAPTTVSWPAGWRDHPLPGAARPVVVEVGT
jgi:hypothetical protein